MVEVSFMGYKSFNDFLEKIELTDADYIHVDVKDNKFVKGHHDPFLDLYKNFYTKNLDVHLMCDKPDKFIPKYAKLNTDYISFHVETENVAENLELIASFGIKKGLAIRPSSDLSLLLPYLKKIDYILLMSVEPGLSGQKFMEETYERLEVLKEMIKGTDIVIAVDGGINDTNALKLRNLGADILISSSFITSGDFQEGIGKLR